MCEERGAGSGIRLNYDRDLTLSYSPREFLHITTVSFTFTGLGYPKVHSQCSVPSSWSSSPLHNKSADLAAELNGRWSNVGGGSQLGDKRGRDGCALSGIGIPLTELTDAAAAIWPDLRPFSILSKLNSSSSALGDQQDQDQD